MTVSVAVMAHPKRATFVPHLVKSLDAEATVVWDEHNDRWDTGRRAMLAFDPSTTHHLVIQDDAIACRDLVAGVEKALVYVPHESPVGLYVGRVQPWRARIQKLVDEAEENTSWLTMARLLWGVGVVVPTDQIPDMVAFCDRRRHEANYDLRMAKWFMHRGIRVWCTWPSLVEHRDSPSLVPGRTATRHAHRFIGARRSALDVDWSGNVIDMED